MFLRVPPLSLLVQGPTSASLLPHPQKSFPPMRTCAALAACSALWPDEWDAGLSVIAVMAPQSIQKLRRATREWERREEKEV